MMTIETQLTIGDLETYIKVQLEDPCFACVEVDPILDIIIHSKHRLENGDYMPRVVSEAMASLDEYLFDHVELEACAI
ncbi:MAG: hypothetical protein HN457_18360 [Opitutales bacterium]|jgi:hypothetical protein|nr:hypothetical protein [Opitutales bacterium]MBT5166996.1 hypothetical protein [Opitutales bacterium]MBT5813897.1 hypothetical protein [Opitutales bacterium]MBT6769596.1 hypothetical protein [Opitutales bacterium]